MEPVALQNRIKAAEIPLERLAGNPNLSEADKAAEVSRQFEAVLLRQILTQAQKPVFKSSIVSSSLSNDIYQDQVVNQLADNISKAGAFGLAQSFQKQLTRQTAAAQAARDAAAQAAGGKTPTL